MLPRREYGEAIRCPDYHVPGITQGASRRHESRHKTQAVIAKTGRLVAYVLDGEAENPVRVAQDRLRLHIKEAPAEDVAVDLEAVASALSGEKVGDTSQFEAQADWLKTDKEFDAVLKNLVVRGNKYDEIKFNFPKGNDTDEKTK